MNGSIGSGLGTVRARAPRVVVGLMAALAAVTSMGRRRCTRRSTAADFRSGSRQAQGDRERSAALGQEQGARQVPVTPVETLAFFGIRPNMTVVELWPFGGWFNRDHRAVREGYRYLLCRGDGSNFKPVGRQGIQRRAEGGVRCAS